MLYPRLTTIEIQGYRSFGAEAQIAEIESPIAVFWGPNSKGKTSFAEAVEFLLTGRTVKREVLSSRKDEFADSLRHAHLTSDVESFVAATVECEDGSTHYIKRVLDLDYGKQGTCETTLTIDGNEGGESELAALGIYLAQPPLRAPVLAQHTLNYLFTASPSDRSAYFKALLEVTDLDEFRVAVAALEETLPFPDSPVLKKLEQIKALPQASLTILTGDLTDVEVVKQALGETIETILTEEGIPPPDGFAEAISALSDILESKRAALFPLQLFGRRDIELAYSPPDDDWSVLTTYIDEREKVGDEARRLVALFKTVLDIPAFAALDAPEDCPVCESPNALTPDRVEAIRESVESSESFTESEDAAIGVLNQQKSGVDNVVVQVQALLPRYLSEGGEQRRAQGFTIERIRDLLGEQFDALVPPWTMTIPRFLRAQRRVLHAAELLSTELTAITQKPEQLSDVNALRASFVRLSKLQEALSITNEDYKTATAPLYDSLKAIIDQREQTAGWQELIDISMDLDALRDAIVEEKVVATMQSELQAALRQIDRGITRVSDTKYEILSEGVSSWWNLLRGGEPTFFAGVKKRGKITIDFKGGLSPHFDQSSAQERDAIAVFSDSQLHCLGLALFLARVEHYGTSFVVLDDPVLTSDEDYRIHFRCQVMQRLHELGIQTIVLTQHKSTRRDIATVNEHLGVDQFQIDIPDPSRGTVINKTSDEFQAMLASAAPYTTSDDSRIRKDGGRQLRDATERFCKLLLVKKRKESGDASAAVSDYEGEVLGDERSGLVHRTIPYLTVNGAHPGTLRTLVRDLNPPAHDDDGIPSRTALREALGNLKRFRQDYLR